METIQIYENYLNEFSWTYERLQDTIKFAKIIDGNNFFFELSLNHLEEIYDINDEIQSYSDENPESTHKKLKVELEKLTTSIEVAIVLKEAKELGWNYIDEDEMIHLNQYTPAGEDFTFSVEKKNITDNISDYNYYFDPEEHAMEIIKAKMMNISGFPNLKTIIEDSEVIKKRLEKLAYTLNNVKEGNIKNLLDPKIIETLKAQDWMVEFNKAKNTIIIIKAINHGLFSLELNVENFIKELKCYYINFDRETYIIDYIRENKNSSCSLTDLHKKAVEIEKQLRKFILAYNEVSSPI